MEERLGLKIKEQRESFRSSIRKIYDQKMSDDRDYDFMDNLELVKAVTDIRLKSDIAGVGSLIGAHANGTNEENQKLYDHMITTMLNKLGYCTTCAETDPWPKFGNIPTVVLPQECAASICFHEGKTIRETQLYQSLHQRYVHNLKENVMDSLLKNDNFRSAIKDYATEAFKSYDERIREDVNLFM